MKRNIAKEIRMRWPNAPLARDLITSIYYAGEIAKKSDRVATAKAGEGHRSIETAGDSDAQNDVLASLRNHPDLKFLCEEDSLNPRVLLKQNPRGILQGKVVIVDPVDGTSLFASRYPDWCTAGGLMEEGVFTASVFYAPQSNDGMLAASYKDGSLFLSENGKPFQAVAPQVAHEPEKSILLYGVDASLYKNASNFLLEVAPNVLATRSCGSGLFGLMSVSLGRAAAIFQTPQKPWDWAPAYHTVTKTGNIFLFFRIIEGELVPVEHFDRESFSFDKKNRDNRLGFIAGEPGMAHKLFDRLPLAGWDRKQPNPGFFV